MKFFLSYDGCSCAYAGHNSPLGPSRKCCIEQTGSETWPRQCILRGIHTARRKPSITSTTLRVLASTPSSASSALGLAPMSTSSSPRTTHCPTDTASLSGLLCTEFCSDASRWAAKSAATQCVCLRCARGNNCAVGNVARPVLCYGRAARTTQNSPASQASGLQGPELQGPKASCPEARRTVKLWEAERSDRLEVTKLRSSVFAPERPGKRQDIDREC